MDVLSQSKVPFFFMIDFLMENIETYTVEEIKKSGLRIDFPNFKNNCTYKAGTHKNIQWEIFPNQLEIYKKGFEIIQKNVKKGNSYLANYTCQSRVKTNLQLLEIFSLATAKYKVYHPAGFTFFSPETFVEIIGNTISTHPMKGTIDANIDDAQEILKNDVKEKAEHYTVVDLLRNDLSIVANEVSVEYFQRIDFLKTNSKNLYTMSSEISGKLKKDFQNKIGSIMNALLPAGSILGAPKQKTLEIILEAEDYNRGFYTGISGFFDGENLDSCVMIRFIEEKNGELFFKSGGGITHRSNLDQEYQEMKNKIYVPIH